MIEENTKTYRDLINLIKSGADFFVIFKRIFFTFSDRINFFDEKVVFNYLKEVISEFGDDKGKKYYEIGGMCNGSEVFYYVRDSALDGEIDTVALSLHSVQVHETLFYKEKDVLKIIEKYRNDTKSSNQ